MMSARWWTAEATIDSDVELYEAPADMAQLRADIARYEAKHDRTDAAGEVES